MNTSIIEDYLSHGFVTFPLAPMSKQPPLGTSGHLAWELEDSEEVRDDLESGKFNIGIQTGKRSGIVVIDIDPRNGGTRDQVVELFGREINTREHETARGGRHLFFRYPAEVDRIPSVAGKLGAGLDIKADGGYVVAPPSVIAEGTYKMINGGELESLPEHIISRVVPVHRERVESHYQYPEGYWQNVLEWHALNIKEADCAPDGERDDTAYKMLVRSMQLSFTVPDTVLSPTKVTDDFRHGVGYRIKGLGGKSERARLFAELNPRPWPHFAIEASDDDDEKDWTMITDYVGVSSTLAPDKLNDLANAERVAKLLEGRAIHVRGEGWFSWNGKVWQREGNSEDGIIALVANANKQLFEDLRAVELLMPATRDQRLFVTRMNNMQGVKATAERLRGMIKLQTSVESIDAHAHLLTVRNGTIDLRTGDLLPHSPDHLITMMIDIDYDPSARADRWDSFLKEVMPNNPELVPFLQRLVGYGITGEISEHAMAIHYGRGRNGKSVFLGALDHVFGNISSTVDWRSFAQQQNGGGAARSDIARLRGKRLVTVNEGDARTRMDEAQIKRMVSGDAIVARKLYQDEIEFTPKFLLQMATNAKPDFRGADEGLWNRVKLIPWARYFSAEERDHHLPIQLQGEAQGILSWAVRGAMEWYASGLNEPDCVREATQDYRDSADELAGFVGSVDQGAWLVPQEDGVVPASWMLSLYRTWAEQQNYFERDMLNARSLKAAMEERGYGVKHTRNGNIYAGLSANVSIQAVQQAAATIKDASRLTRYAGECEGSGNVIEGRF